MKTNVLIFAAVLGLASPVLASDPCSTSTFYEPDLKVTRWPEAVPGRIALRGGRPTILLGERAEPPWVLALSGQVGSRWSWEERAATTLCQAAQAGLTLFVVDLPLAALWPAADSFSIGLARHQVEGVLARAPEGRVILRLRVDAPPWWGALHPDELAGPAKGQQSLASALWRKEGGHRVRELLRQLAATPEGNAVIGVQLSAAGAGSWQPAGASEGEADASPAMRTRFRQWLRERYKSDGALKAAWGDPSMTLATADPPKTKDLSVGEEGPFRDPSKARRSLDFVDCLQQTATDAALDFAAIVKASWPRPLLCGLEFGAFFPASGLAPIRYSLEWDRILGSSHVDFLNVPQPAASRFPGDAALPGTLVESCRLREKLVFSALPAPRATPALIRRDLLVSLVQGQGVALAGDAPEQWLTSVALREIKALRERLAPHLAADFTPVADVALVLDTDTLRALAMTAEPSPIVKASVDGIAAALTRSGVAFDLVHLADTERVNWSRYKAVIFANAWRLTDKQRGQISGKVVKDKRHVVWIYAPAYNDGRSLSLGGVSSVTDLSIARVTLKRPPVVLIKADDLPELQLGLTDVVQPLLAVMDPDLKPQQGFAENADFAAFVRKRRGAGATWFSSLPITEPALLRAILKQAGVHVYLEEPDFLQAGSGLLGLYSVTGGPRRLTLQDGKQVELTLTPDSMTVLDATTGAQLMAGAF